MANSNSSSLPPSGTGTPNAVHNSRFTSQASTAEDLLSTQTVGLVHLSDFRKRRADALEAKELGRFVPGGASGSVTPSEGGSTPKPQIKKKKKTAAKGKLSFAIDRDEEDVPESSKTSTPRSETPTGAANSPDLEQVEGVKKRLGPNSKLANAPKAMTKSALLKEAQTREQLRKEFLVMQEAVKATEVLIPFVFYDGTNIPGGVCKVKKGDPIWLFLERSRKVGAELGVGSSGGEKANATSRREWARVGVDDLMLVRGEVIIPHHYDFYYFIVNKTVGPSSTPLFPYSAQSTPQSLASATPTTPTDLSNYDPLARPSKNTTVALVTENDANLEGANDDPNLTKVVDRRWYERNKHIFPASVWEDFDAAKDYSNGIRKDAEGNVFFF